MTRLLSGLFEAPVRVVASDLRYTRADLLPLERDLIAKVVQKREREFATGRVLARQLLAEHGLGDFALLRDEDRVPIWPGGFVGSISHTTTEGRDFCVVALAPAAGLLGVGVDAEPDVALDARLFDRICRPAERAWIEAGEPGEAGRRCHVVFSAKEAVYKAAFPTLREVWAFRDVGLEIDLESGRFEAALPASAAGRKIEGRIRRHDGWIATGATFC